MRFSSEVKRGIAKNFRSPRDREEFSREWRRVEHSLKARERKSSEESDESDRCIFDSLEENLEETVSDLMRRKEISRGARTVHLLSYQ